MNTKKKFILFLNFFINLVKFYFRLILNLIDFLKNSLGLYVIIINWILTNSFFSLSTKISYTL